jgi:hypothetical protein
VEPSGDRAKWEEVRSLGWGHALEDLGPSLLTSLSLSPLPSHHEVSSFAPPCAPAMMLSLTTGPKATEPTNHQLWTETSETLSQNKLLLLLS